MTDSMGFAEPLLQAMRTSDRLPLAYASFLESLFAHPLWAAGDVLGRRIPWRAASAARRASPAGFDSPGVYLFGARAVPLYIGSTGRTLWVRLRGRYLVGQYSQCQLAATYADSIREKGVDGFPEEVRVWYRRGFRGSRVRLEGAVVFARQGIEDIWFALLPMASAADAKQLEDGLIPVAQRWNSEHGHPPLLNKQGWFEL